MQAAPQKVKIGGKDFLIRRSGLATFRLGGLPYGPPSNPDRDGATQFRWVCISAWTMLDDAAAFASPEALALAVNPDERAPLKAAVLACFAPPSEQKKSSTRKPRSSSRKRA